MKKLRLSRTSLVRITVLLLSGAASISGPGCQPSQSGKLDSAISAYNAGSYQRAFDEARSSRLSSTGTARAESAYVAGLAAMKIERPVTARSLLEEASRSSNDELSGRADVSLGTLLLEDHEPLAAAQAYDRAATKLDGTDRARARQRAGLAYQQAGVSDVAQQRLRQSAESESVLPGRFTIQGGFYTERSGAVKRAEQLSGTSRVWKLGPAMVVPTTARGSAGYAVQVGDFANRADAEMARRSLGDTKTFVTKIAQR